MSPAPAKNLIGRNIAMLFRKKMPRSCVYCVHSAKYSEDQMLCTKYGVVSMYYECRKFRYDPFKRIPAKPKALDFSKYEQDDFSL